MEYIAHRVNTVAELKELSTEYGVELDLRDDLNGRIYIQHNPFEPGEDFEERCCKSAVIKDKLSAEC